MVTVEPIIDTPAALAISAEDRALVVADYHAGIESSLRAKGLEVDDHSDERRDRLLTLIKEQDVTKLIFLGDLVHWIGAPEGSELEEVRRLIDSVTELVPVHLIKGNHDGQVEDAVDISVSEGAGEMIGEVGYAHGHSHPAKEVLDADIVCTGHEHVAVRMTDSVGGSYVRRAWLRGQLEPSGFENVSSSDSPSGELIVFPAFNNWVGGQRINVGEHEFLSPFLPKGIKNAEAYLLDGTRLGDYRSI